MLTPGVLIDGAPFSFGRLSGRKLRETLATRDHHHDRGEPQSSGGAPPTCVPRPSSATRCRTWRPTRCSWIRSSPGHGADEARTGAAERGAVLSRRGEPSPRYGRRSPVRPLAQVPTSPPRSCPGAIRHTNVNPARPESSSSKRPVARQVTDQVKDMSSVEPRGPSGARRGRRTVPWGAKRTSGHRSSGRRSVGWPIYRCATSPTAGLNTTPRSLCAAAADCTRLWRCRGPSPDGRARPGTARAGESVPRGRCGCGSVVHQVAPPQ